MNNSNSTTEKQESIYKQLGGKDALVAAVDLFYQKVMNDVLLKPFFNGIDMKTQKQHMVRFMSYAFGGNKTYKGRSLGEAHTDLVKRGLNETHFIAVAEHLESTLKELKINKPLRDQVMAIVGSTKDEVLGTKKQKDMAIGKNLENDKVISEKGSEVKSNDLQENVDFLQVMEGSVLSIVVINQQGTVQFFNESAEKLWGYRREEIIGKNVKVLTPPEIQREHDDYLQRYNTTGRRNVMGGSREVKALRKDGTLVDVFLSLSEATTAGEVIYVAFIQDITEKKKLEEEVREQLDEAKIQEDRIKNLQERTEQTLEQAIDSVVTINSKKEITFFNKAAEDMFGYSRNEVMGQNVKMIVPLEHRARHDDYVESNMETGINKVVGASRDILMTRRNGSEFWGNLSLSKVVVGGDVQYTAFIKDISEQVQEKQKNREILEQALDGVITIDSDRIITFYNKAAEKIFGYTKEEVIGSNVNMIVPQEHKANHDSYVKNNIKSGVNKVVGIGRDLEMVRKDGSRFWGNLSLSKVDVGGTIQYTAFVKDITQERDAKLKASKIQNAVDVGWAFVEFEPDGTVIEANEAFLNTLGYRNLSEIKGQHHSIFVRSDYAKSTEYSQFWNNLSNGIIQRGEHLRVKKDGQEIWLQAAYAPIMDENDKVTSVIKIATDISAVKFPVMMVSNIITDMAKGNLTRKFDMNTDGYVKEMGDALNIALDNLKNILSTIETSSMEVAKSAESMMDRAQGMKNNSAEVSSAISQMSKGAQDQAQRTDESSKLAEQVLESAGEMESNSDIINKAAEKGVKSCEDGLKIIKNMVENMSGINDSAGLTSESINVLTERAEEIARTLNVITDIAAQTNLLALNAAIEAARAGEAGRGFAVVAEEIRKLAEDSRKSAIDIEKIIADVQKDTQSASKAIDTMTTSVKEGTGATKEAENIFAEISESSQDTLEMSKAIKEASGKQKSSIDTVVKNIEQIVVVAEETAAGTEEIATSSSSLDKGMEEVAAASDQLSKIAADLKEKVSKFKLK